jgi:hypothetical protein
MTPTNDYIERLEQYLSGQLSAQETRAIEKEIAENPEMQEYLTLLKGFEGLHQAHFLEQTKSWEQKYKIVAEPSKTPTETPIARPTFWFKIRQSSPIYRAAAVLLFLSLPLGYWLSGGALDNSPGALAMQMFDAHQVLNININNNINNRGAGEAVPEKIKKMQAVLDMGTIAYNRASYAEAITHFNKILSTADVDALQYEEISYLLGISYLANKQAGQAIPIFERLIREETSRKDESQWYLALALIKEKQVEKGSQLLHTIAEQPYHQKLKKAKELLKLLE